LHFFLFSFQFSFSKKKKPTYTVPTHSKKCGSTTINKEFFTLGLSVQVAQKNFGQQGQFRGWQAWRKTGSRSFRDCSAIRRDDIRDLIDSNRQLTVREIVGNCISKTILYIKIILLFKYNSRLCSMSA
jgi:hypothetical protein